FQAFGVEERPHDSVAAVRRAGRVAEYQPLLRTHTSRHARGYSERRAQIFHSREQQRGLVLPQGLSSGARQPRSSAMKRRDWMKAAAGAALALPRLAPAQIPAHPSQLSFDPIEFEPPDAAQYRRELPGGAIAYLVEDHQFPLVDISL